MTYRENMQALLRRENINLNQIEANTQQKMKNADIAAKETIENIQSASDLLIGNRDTQFKQGLEGAEVQGEGILPWWYGRHVRDKSKKGIEAEKKDRKDRLERLAVIQNQLNNLKDIDKAHHDAKFNMLLNGAYYEDADRFAKLSPHSQVAYAKNKLNLYNETIESKLSLWMSKDGNELDVNGLKYTPSSVTGIPLAPLALKEHALNVGLDKIRSDNGINGFNSDFLELAGTTTKEQEAKKNLMSKYRSQYDIDSSYQTRLKEIKAFTEDGDYDFNHLLSVFRATKDERGNLLNYKGSWDEAMKMLTSMGVSGNLPDEVIERIKNTIDPRTGLRYIDDPSKAVRFLKLENDIERKRKEYADGAALADENARAQLKVKFKKMVDNLESGDSLDERDLAWFQMEYTKYNGPGVPDYLSTYLTSQDRDDNEDKEAIIRLYKRRGGDNGGGFLVPQDFWGMNPAVYRWAMQTDPKDANSGLLFKSNENGYATGEQLLKDTGKGSVTFDLTTMIEAALKNSGYSEANPYDNWSLALGNAKAQFRLKYYEARNVHGMSESQAITAGLEHVKTLLKTDGTGFMKADNPVNSSIIFKDTTPSAKEIRENNKLKIKLVEKINAGLVKYGKSDFLSTKDGLLTELGSDTILEAIKYLKGEIPVPQIYIDITDKIPGLNADKLARMQVLAAIDADPDLSSEGIDLETLIDDSNEPNPWRALDLENHRDVVNSFGYKSSPFSKCQTRACINDQLYKIRTGDINIEDYKEGKIELPKSHLSQEGKVTDSKSGDFNVPSGEENKTESTVSQLGENIKDEQKKEEEAPIIEDLIREDIGKDDLEATILAHTSLPEDKEIMEKYFGGTDRTAQLKYTLAAKRGFLNKYRTTGEIAAVEKATGMGQTYSKQKVDDIKPREIDYEAANEAVEALILDKIDPTAVEKNFPLTGDYTKDMSYSWVQQKIEAGELELIPIGEDGAEITPIEAKKLANTPHPKKISGISSYYKDVTPERTVKYRLVDLTKEPVNELQSSAFTVPGSPYLAPQFQQYAGQLIAMNVGQDPTIPVSLDKAETDLDKWNWVVDQARKSGAKYPELVAAQFMIESGRGANVSGTHNYFGLKTTATDPESTWLETSEFKNGKWVKVMAPFKNFDSPEAAIQYLSKLWYKDFGAYKGANNGKDINAAIQVLIKGDYATDPDYTTKLLKILQEFEKLKAKPTKIKTA
tara:strand:+ start:2349 stop:5972 length:3624 start_codon:yes stop_codon:yes gene_type:complete